MRILKLAIISLSVCFLILEASAFQASESSGETPPLMRRSAQPLRLVISSICLAR